MGWVLMSEREVHRVEVLSGVVAGRGSSPRSSSITGARASFHRATVLFLGACSRNDFSWFGVFSFP